MGGEEEEEGRGGGGGNLINVQFFALINFSAAQCLVAVSHRGFVNHRLLIPIDS